MRRTDDLVKRLIEVTRKQTVEALSISGLMPEGFSLTRDEIKNLYDLDVMRFIYLLMTSSKELTNTNRIDFNNYFDLNFTTINQLKEFAAKVELTESYTDQFPFIFRLAIIFDNRLEEFSKRTNIEGEINIAEKLLTTFKTIGEEIVAMNCSDNEIATLTKDMYLIYLERCIKEPKLMPKSGTKKELVSEDKKVSNTTDNHDSCDGSNFEELKKNSKKKIDNVYNFLAQIQPSNMEVPLTETYKLDLRDFLFYVAYLDGNINSKELGLINYLLGTSYTFGDLSLLKENDELPRQTFYENAPRALIILTAAVNSETDKKDGSAAKGFIANYRYIGLTVLYLSDNLNDDLIEKLDAYLDVLTDYVDGEIEGDE